MKVIGQPSRRGELMRASGKAEGRADSTRGNS